MVHLNKSPRLQKMIRNPLVEDLPAFIATLSKSDKEQMCKMMEEEFAKQHYQFNKARLPSSKRRNKTSKLNLVQVSYDKLKTIDTNSTNESKRKSLRESLVDKNLKVEIPSKLY